MKDVYSERELNENFTVLIATNKNVSLVDRKTGELYLTSRIEAFLKPIKLQKRINQINDL